MKKVILHGNLGLEFGREWNLSIESFSECLKAIESNKPGFYSFIVSEAKKGVQYCFKTEYGRVIEKEELHMSTQLDKLHVSPLIYGAGAGLDLGSLGMSFGIGLLSSYIGGKIMDKLRPKNISDPERLSTNSYSFTGPENVISQGSPVPVGYGQLIVGSNVISEAQINYDFNSKEGVISNFSYPLDRFRGDNSFTINTSDENSEKGNPDWSVKKGFAGYLQNAINYSAQRSMSNHFYRDSLGVNINTVNVSSLLSKDRECVVQSLYGDEFSIYNETGMAGLQSAKVGPRFVASDGITEISYKQSLVTEDKQLGFKKLESTSVYKVLDLICEGPIEGFVDEAGNVDNFSSLIKNEPPVICGNVSLSPQGTFECDSQNESEYNKLFHLEQIQVGDLDLATGIAIVDSGVGYDENSRINFFIQAPGGKEDPQIAGTSTFFRTWQRDPRTNITPFNLLGEIDDTIINGGAGMIPPLSADIPFPEKELALANAATASPFMTIHNKPIIGNGDPVSNRNGDAENMLPENWRNNERIGPQINVIEPNVRTATSDVNGQGLFKEISTKSIDGREISLSSVLFRLSSIVDNLYVSPDGGQPSPTDLKLKYMVASQDYMGPAIEQIQNVGFNLTDVLCWPFQTYQDLSLISLDEVGGRLMLRGSNRNQLLIQSGLRVFWNAWAPILGMITSPAGMGNGSWNNRATISAFRNGDTTNSFGINGPLTMHPDYDPNGLPSLNNRFPILYFGPNSMERPADVLPTRDMLGGNPGSADNPRMARIGGFYEGRADNARIYFQNKDEPNSDAHFLDEKINLSVGRTIENVVDSSDFSAFNVEPRYPLVAIHQLVGCLLKIADPRFWDVAPNTLYNWAFINIGDTQPIGLNRTIGNGRDAITYAPWRFNEQNFSNTNEGNDFFLPESNNISQTFTDIGGAYSVGTQQDDRKNNLTNTIFQFTELGDRRALDLVSRFSLSGPLFYRTRRELNDDAGNLIAVRAGFDPANEVYPRIRIGQNISKENQAYYEMPVGDWRDATLDDNRPVIEMGVTQDQLMITSMGFPANVSVAPTVGEFNDIDKLEVVAEFPHNGVNSRSFDKAGSAIGDQSKGILSAYDTNIGYNAMQLIDFYDTPDRTTARSIIFQNCVQNSTIQNGYRTIPGRPEPPIAFQTANRQNDNEFIENVFMYSAFHQEIHLTPKYYLENPDRIPEYYSPASAVATIKDGQLNGLFLHDAGFGYPDQGLDGEVTVYVTLPHPNPAWIVNSGRKINGEFTDIVDVTKTGIDSNNYENHLILRPNQDTGVYQRQAVLDVDNITVDNNGAITDLNYITRGAGYTQYFLEEAGDWSTETSSYVKPTFNFDIDEEMGAITGISLLTSASGYTADDFQGGLDFRIVKSFDTPADSNAWAKSVYLDDVPLKNTKTNDFNFSSFDFSVSKSIQDNSIEVGSALNDPLPIGFQYSFRSINYESELFGPRIGIDDIEPDPNQAPRDPEKGENANNELTENLNYQVGAPEYPITHVVDDELVTYVYATIDVESLLYLYEGDKQVTMMDLTRLALTIVAYIIITKMVEKLLLDTAEPPESTAGMGFSSPTGGPVPVGNYPFGYLAIKILKIAATALFNVGITAAAVFAAWGIAGTMGSIKIFRINMGERIKNSGETRPSFLRFQIKYYNEGATGEAGQLSDYNAIHSTEIDFKGVVNGSSYSKDIKILLPPNPQKRKRFIEISRLSRERDYVRGGEKESRFQEKASLKSITEIKPVNLNYANSVVFASKINAEEFSSIPKREYHLRLKKVRVPNNYDPTSRTYFQETWDGEFSKKLKWTNNPAWCFYDLITNSRFGLGRFGIKDKYANKWNLYSIAKYCDELVYTGISNRFPFRDFQLSQIIVEESMLNFQLVGAIDGPTFTQEFGTGEESIGEISIISEDSSFISRGIIHEINGQSLRVPISSTKFNEMSNPEVNLNNTYRIVREFDGKIVEPRFSFNAYIREEQDALNLINDITSLFNSIIYWSEGEIYLSSDQPKDPIMLFNNSNISSNGFNYSSTRKDQRYTVCKVRYNDENDKYKPKIEYVESAEGIQKYGIIENSLAPIGLTSRTQAQRAGRYLLTSSLNETEMIDFSARLEANYLRPGDIIKILDNNRINQRLAGMIVDIDSAQGSVGLDFPIDSIVESPDSDSYLKFNTYSPSGNILNNDRVSDSSKTSLFHPTQISELYVTGLSADKNSVFLAERSQNETYSSNTPSFRDALSRMKVGHTWAVSNTNAGVEADFGLYRIITVSEQGDNEYNINAIQHTPSKFDFIDQKNEKALVTKSLGPYIDIEKPEAPTRKALNSPEQPTANGDIVTYDPNQQNRGRGQTDYFRIMRSSNTDEGGVTTHQWYAVFNWVSTANVFYRLYFSNKLVEDGYIRTTDGSSFRFNLKTYSEKHFTALDVEGVEEDNFIFNQVRISSKITLLVYGYSGNPEEDNVVLSNDFLSLEYNPEIDMVNLNQDITTSILDIRNNLSSNQIVVQNNENIGAIQFMQGTDWLISPQLNFFYPSEEEDGSAWVYVAPDQFPIQPPPLSGWTFIPSTMETEDLNGTGVMNGWVYRFGHNAVTSFDPDQRWSYLYTENNSGVVQVADASAGNGRILLNPQHYDLSTVNLNLLIN